MPIVIVEKGPSELIGDSVFDDRGGVWDRARMGGDGKGSGGFQGSIQTPWVYEVGVWYRGV